MVTDPFDFLSNRLDGVRDVKADSFMARCPVPGHDDNGPSLHVTRGNVQPFVVKCFAGCTQAQVMGSLRAQFPEEMRNGNRPRQPPAVWHPYYHDDGSIAFHIKRSSTWDDVTGEWVKTFKPWGRDRRHPIKDPPTLLYNLPAVRRAVATGQPVWLVEGEKDADALIGVGIVATTKPFGAQGWHKVAEHAHDVLNGAHVVMCGDDDAKGRAYARDVVRSLREVVATITVRQAAAGFKDAAEHLGAGRSVDEFVTIESIDDWLAGDEPVEPPDLHIVAIGDVEPVDVTWLWFERLPYGMVVVLDGDPGLAKSAMTIDWAARLSNGMVFPGDPHAPEPGNTLILSAEDDLARTIRPRCEVAGADMRRIICLNEVPVLGEDGGTTWRMPQFPNDTAGLETIIRKYGAVLVIIDVLAAYVARGFKINDTQDMRTVLKPLRDVAERTNCCIVVLRHLNKTAGSSAMYRGGGSVSVIGAARVGLIVGEHPDDKEIDDVNARRKVLAVNKTNLGKYPPSIEYSTVDVNGIVAIEWGKLNGVTANQLVGVGAIDDASDVGSFLRDLLNDSPVYADTVFTTGEEAGYSKSQLRRAARRNNVKIDKERKVNGRWFWSLPGVTGS